MAKVTYVPTDDMVTKTSQFGFDFDAGKPVDVPTGRALQKFHGHPFFHVEGDEEPVTTGLVAKHRGRGTYGVFDGDQLLDGIPAMTKEDADAFNALSDAEKHAYVDAAPTPAV